MYIDFAVFFFFRDLVAALYRLKTFKADKLYYVVSSLLGFFKVQIFCISFEKV